MMLSAFSLGYLIMQPVGGWIADKFGPRRTLAGSMAGWSLWVLMTPIAPTVLWLTATFRVLLGAFEGPYIPASVAAVARADPVGRAARPVLRLRAVGRAAWAGGRRLLRRHHPEHHRLADLYFRDLRSGRAGRRGRVVELRPQFRRSRADRSARGNRRSQDSAPRKRRCRTRLLITSPALWPFYIGYFALPYCQYLFLDLAAAISQPLPPHPARQGERAQSALPFLVAFVASNFTGWAMDWLAAAGWTKGGFHRKFFVGLGARDLRRDAR